jgi:hypothetical protein
VLNALVILTILVVTPGLLGHVMTRRKGFVPLSISLTHGIVIVFLTAGGAAVGSRLVSFPFNAITLLMGYLLTLILTVKWLSHIPRNHERSSHISTVVGLTTFSVSVIGHLAIWKTALDLGNIIPNHDAMHHTMWTANMARFNGLDSTVAYFNQFTGFAPGDALYPFSFHVLAASPVQLGVARPSQSVVASTLLIASFVWPLSVFSIARALRLKPHIGAGLASIFTVATYAMPYNTLGWGGVTMITGVALLVHAVSTVIEWFQANALWFAATLALSSIALLVTHTSEAFLLSAFAAILLWPRRGQLATGSRRLLLLVVFAGLCFVYPWIDRSFGPGHIASLADVSAPGGGAVYQIVGHIIMLTPGMELHSLWVLILFLMGLVGRRKSLQLSTAALWVFTAALMFLAGMLERPYFSDLSFALAPWYRQFQRMSYLVVPALVLFAASSLEPRLETLVTWLTKSRIRIKEAFLSTILVMAFSLFVVVTSLPTTQNVARILFGTYATMTDDALTIPDRNPELLDPESTVLASFDSGVGYWAADFGVKVLAAPFLSSELLAEREAMLDTISSFATSAEAREKLTSLGITHVATNTRSMSGPPRPDNTALESSDDFELLEQSTSVALWKVKPVVGGFAGSVAPIPTSDDRPKMLMTRDDVRIGIHNLSSKPQRATVSFTAVQNECTSAQNITIGDVTESTFETKKVELSFFLDLAPRESWRRSVRVTGQTCVYPETGNEYLIALTEPRITIE